MNKVVNESVNESVNKSVNKRKTGAQWEEQAVQYLKDNGYLILERNYRCKIGEIDIIAKDRDEIVFIEVKYRRGNKMGYALEAVTPAKQNTIRKVAQVYMTTVCKSQYVPCRFDVMGFDGTDGKVTVSHIKNAF